MRAGICVVGMVWVLALTYGCGSSPSMPHGLLSAMDSTEAALDEGDTESVCTGLMQVRHALYEWQEFARGNQVVTVQELLHRVESIGYECSSRQGDDEEIQLEGIAQAYREWATFARKKTTREGNFGTIMMWILIPMLAGGFLMFWRRKFREA